MIEYSNKKNILKDFFTLIIIGVLVFLFVVYFGNDSTKEDTVTETENVIVYFGEREVLLEVVDTPEARKQGLSGREELLDGTGMFFVFDEPGRQGIWMKDMNFAIDVLWLDENFQIIYMVENMTPESFPKSYRSRKPSLYVVELPLGFIEKNSISTGDQMTPLRSSDVSVENRQLD